MNFSDYDADGGDGVLFDVIVLCSPIQQRFQERQVLGIDRFGGEAFLQEGFLVLEAMCFKYLLDW
ncbi:hypothetical protein VI26_00335 [Chromobacterium sp. LK1]|nr:hypothetical protein VI26_00335 [Chromobacterium sp. LK1]